eukprot:11365192-Alexandrium_andersonii.AAC.1
MTAAHRLVWSYARRRLIGGQVCEWLIPLPADPRRSTFAPPQGQWPDLDIGIPFCALVTVLFSLVTGNVNREQMG